VGIYETELSLSFHVSAFQEVVEQTIKAATIIVDTDESIFNHLKPYRLSFLILSASTMVKTVVTIATIKAIIAKKVTERRKSARSTD
jgi:hypothetical protein